METIRTDAVVIGSGPGGYVAGIRLGQLGKKCVAVERDAVGGVCLNIGCIPSKALISAGKSYEKAKHGDEIMGISTTGVKVDMARLQAWKGEVVGKMTSGVKLLLKSANAQTLLGTATIVGPGKVEVKGESGTVLVEGGVDRSSPPGRASSRFPASKPTASACSIRLARWRSTRFPRSSSSSAAATSASSWA